MSLNDFKNTLREEVFPGTAGLKEKGICIHCKEEAAPKCYTELGHREFRISGICEKCWDKIMIQDEEDNYDV